MYAVGNGLTVLNVTGIQYWFFWYIACPHTTSKCAVVAPKRVSFIAVLSLNKYSWSCFRLKIAVL